MKRINLVGKTFGRLTVIQFHGIKKKKVVWLCACECGSKSPVEAGNLSSGNTVSCGCFRRERQVQCAMKHGGKVGGKMMPEYRCWKAIKDRCYNKNSIGYKYYGGRGVSVCERWKNSFPNFLNDMGTKPASKHSIDRIDPNGNYEPRNCRWATHKEQASNMRSNRWLEFDGATKTLSQWSESSGLPASLLCQRLAHGWTFERAITTPRRGLVAGGV